MMTTGHVHCNARDFISTDVTLHDMIVQLLNMLCLKTADRVEIVTLLHFIERAHKRNIFVDHIAFETVVNFAFMLLQAVPDMIPRCVRISEDRGTEHTLISHRY